MPFTHYLTDQYVLFYNVSELSLTVQGEVSHHRDRMEDDDGVADAMLAAGILAVGHVEDEVLNRAEPHNIKNAVERAYKP